mgnify:CR=1 FL=1
MAGRRGPRLIRARVQRDHLIRFSSSVYVFAGTLPSMAVGICPRRLREALISVSAKHG